MNNKRRKRIDILKRNLMEEKENLKELASELSLILSEEEDVFDNIPEGLQSSYRGMCSEDAIDTLSDADDKLDEVIELLGDIM